jgi:hypothetical protein
VLSYLMAEFDDGKSELILPKADLWLETKLRVEPESRRWFPQSSRSFGKELSRLKQALRAKGFEVGDGYAGTGKNKKRVTRVARIDVEATDENRWEQIKTEASVASNPLQNTRKEAGGTDGTDNFASFPVRKEKI